MHELVFIDTAVQDWEVLRDAVRPGAEVHLLDPMGDELAQMIHTIIAHHDISAIHILSHGQPGAMMLGGRVIDTAVLKRYEALLKLWRASLTLGADLLLYGCELGKGNPGVEFVGSVAELIGIDVAASDNFTGTSRLGGDWVLEYVVGELDVTTALRSSVAFDSLLATASDGTYNFSSFTQSGSGATSRLTSTHFIGTGTLNGSESGLTKSGSIAYGSDNSGSGTGRLIISADGVNTYSFELTGISLNDYNNSSPQYNYKLVGVTTTGSTVQSQNILAPGSGGNAVKDTFDTAAFGFANFAGVQLTSFYVEFEVNSSGGTNDMDFNSFTIANAQPPATASTVTLPVNPTSIAEAAGTSTVTATLSASASADTTVTLTATGTATGSGTDYTLSATTITITAGNTTGTATVTAVQDTLDEDNETVILDITGVSGGGGATENGTQ